MASTSYLLSLGSACFEAPYRTNPSCLYPVAGLLRPDQVRIQSRGWALCLTSDHKNTTLDAHTCLMLSSPPAGVQPGTCSRLPQVGDLRLWGASPLQARCGSWGPGTSLSWAWHQFPSPPRGCLSERLVAGPQPPLRVGSPLLPFAPSHSYGCHHSMEASEWPCRYIGPLFGSPGL